MLIEGIQFPEIQTEYDYFTARLENKEIKLLYRIRQYVIIPTKEKIERLRRNSVQIKLFKKMKNNGHKKNLLKYPNWILFLFPFKSIF